MASGRLTFSEALARLPGGRFEGKYYRAVCPLHGTSDLNLSVWPDDNGNACFKCWSHRCSTRDIVAALRATQVRSQQPLMVPSRARASDEKQRIENALRIWREARDPRGTIVHDYLFGRGFTGEMPWEVDPDVDQQVRLDLRAGLSIPASIRFHPRLWHSPGLCFPGMVAAIENVQGEIVGVHRSFLKPDGSGKAGVEGNKRALGRERRCAVHLGAGAPELVICEGIETGLSILHRLGLHVWVALGTANLGQVELPDFVETVVIAGDNDPSGAGQKAAEEAAAAYRASGRRVKIAIPRTCGEDWNDVLTK